MKSLIGFQQHQSQTPTLSTIKYKKVYVTYLDTNPSQYF